MLPSPLKLKFALSVALVAGMIFLSSCGKDPSASEQAATPEKRVETFCSACHLLPPPATLPRGMWERKIDEMYELARGSQKELPAGLPPRGEAVTYFTSRAPEGLPGLSHTVGKRSPDLGFDPIGVRIAGLESYPGVSSVRLVNLSSVDRFDLLICEMRLGLVLAARPDLEPLDIRVLGRCDNPCTAEVVDLDRDGHRDLLVADLGTRTPSDVKNGKVLWFRGDAKGEFDVIPLASGLGRVAHCQAADFDGDGDLDIVAAVFGWRKVGGILLLENETSDFSSPRFVPHVLDPRPGAIHVPVVDLDGDGDQDFVALISQHHETIVAFLNDGSGGFRKETVFRAPHPNWGSTGIQLVDMDRDGDLDVLSSNGDSLDDFIPKPYHGIQWHENDGDYPFKVHPLTNLYGCNAAKAADIDGDGDVDIFASVFLPYIRKETPGSEFTESLVWLEQVEPGRFERYSLEKMTCFHPTLDLGDFDNDGDVDLVVGNMTMAKRKEDTLAYWAVLWKNKRR
ncbi:MAG: VCBS repeat-containing protein [Planctomycetota bacterium]